jgi:hypothetical protein
MTILYMMARLLKLNKTIDKVECILIKQVELCDTPYLKLNVQLPAFGDDTYLSLLAGTFDDSSQIVCFIKTDDNIFRLGSSSCRFENSNAAELIFTEQTLNFSGENMMRYNFPKGENSGASMTFYGQNKNCPFQKEDCYYVSGDE